MSGEECIIYPHKPGNKEITFFIISGFLLSVPMTIFFETTASGYLPNFLSIDLSRVIFTIIVAPIIEEFAKIFPIFYRHGETERSLIILGFSLGLGFGISEFVEYVFFYDASFYLRLPIIFFHASTTSIIAYGISLGQTYRYYIVAVILHFFVNSLAMIKPYPVAAFILVLGVAFAMFSRFYLISSDKFNFK
jgi:RsiW-degrading membrane proteinase PrsW (M82 family)